MGPGAGVAAVVLAAGEGARFGPGEPKLLRPLRGRPLASWAIGAALEAGLDALAVVTGATDLGPVLAGLGGPVTVLVNPAWRTGQATSLRRALDWCAEQGLVAAVVGLADQPFVPASAWRAVAAEAGAPVVTATYDGRRRPPVRLDRSVWSMLAEGGDEGARELMRRRPDLVREVACDGDPTDVDTVEDLDRLRAAAGARGSLTDRTTQGE